MRVVYIGAFAGQPDEGMRHLSLMISDRMSARCPVLRLDTRVAVLPRSLAEARRFSPTVVHYLSGPTVRSLAVLKLYQTILPRARTVASAVRPALGPTARLSLTVLRPSLVLTQDPRWERKFREAGINVCFLPNGVDLSRFRSASDRVRSEWRRRLQITPETKVALHVGHLKLNRNLDVLVGMQQSGRFQTVIVASAGQERDAGILEALRAQGCIVVDEFLPNVEEVYSCADIYVFPVKPVTAAGAIDAPLSVLEAMASDLPVITTRMPAFERQFSDDALFRWFDGTAQDALRQASLVQLPGRGNRLKVKALDWSAIASRLEELYSVSQK